MGGERGVALVSVTLLLVVVAALAAALAMSASTETAIVRHLQAAAEATAAADAGLNHAVVWALERVEQWEEQGFPSASDAMSALLGQPGHSGRIALDQAAGTEYDFVVLDDDDPARGAGLSPADRLRIGEDGNALRDRNSRIVARATGYARTGGVARAEAALGPLVFPALVANGNLTIAGPAVVGGTEGGVHANGTLSLAGGAVIARDATASGGFSGEPAVVIGGEWGGGYPRKKPPQVRVAAYRSKADVVLGADGQAVGGSADSGWTYAGAGRWILAGHEVAEGTYYVEGDASITGSPGADGVVHLSVIAEGSIEIGGHPRLRPDLPAVLFVAGTDLRVHGLLVATAEASRIVAGRTLTLQGSSSIVGQLLAGGDVRLEGNPTLAFDGGLEPLGFRVSGRRRVP